MRARSVQLKSVRAINNIGAFAQAGKTKRRTDSGDKRRIKKIQPAAATPIEALLLPLSLWHLPLATSIIHVMYSRALKSTPIT